MTDDSGQASELDGLAGGERDTDRTTAAERVLLLTPAEDEVTAPKTRHRHMTLISPRRWRRWRGGVGTLLMECPYCLALVVDYRAADEHLWRLHARNTSDQAGRQDLIPWLVELDATVTQLIEDLGYEPASIWWTGRGQAHEFRHRRRRRWLKLWQRDQNADDPESVT